MQPAIARITLSAGRDNTDRFWRSLSCQTLKIGQHAREKQLKRKIYTRLVFFLYVMSSQQENVIVLYRFARFASGHCGTPWYLSYLTENNI